MGQLSTWMRKKCMKLSQNHEKKCLKMCENWPKIWKKSLKTIKIGREFGKSGLKNSVYWSKNTKKIVKIAIKYAKNR